MAAVQLAVPAAGGLTTRVLLSRPSAPARPHAAAQVVVFFEGDQVMDDDTRAVLGDLAEPHAHLAHVARHFPCATTLAVQPSSVAAGGAACFGAFLPAMTASGEPLEPSPQAFRAAAHLADLLAAAAAAGGTGAGAGGETGGEAEGEAEGEAAAGRAAAEEDGAAEATAAGRVGAGAAGAGAEVQLVGFSKGAVVLNQLLAEMAWHEEALAAGGGGPPGTARAEGGASAPWGAGAVAAADGIAGSGLGATYRPPTAAPPAPAPPRAAAALDAVRRLHFLDAGLNCRGVHVTSPGPVAQLGRRHARIPLEVHVHGTPRQWGDRKRPWIAAEKERFVALLRGAGVPTVVEEYFAGARPSLRQHFEVLQHMRVGT